MSAHSARARHKPEGRRPLERASEATNPHGARVAELACFVPAAVHGTVCRAVMAEALR